jgi:protein-disulfide isomerase
MNPSFLTRTPMHRLTVPVLALAVTLAGCADQAPPASADAPRVGVSGSAADTPDILAVIGDDEITLADVRGRIGEQLDNLDINYGKQRHAMLTETVQELLRLRLLEAEASARGITTSELLESEIADPVITDAQIETVFDANRDRLGGATLEDVRGQIEDFLLNTYREQAVQALQDSLAAVHGVRYNLPPFRLTIDNVGAPALGPSDAAVTLVEFSDFECPFCSRFFPTLKRIQADYGSRVRIVYRQFPLTAIHPNAFKAAEASLCAQEQDRFWDYHDVLFQEQDRLAVRDLKEKAGRLGLDQAEFDGCLDSGRMVGRVQDDLSVGRTAGVSGTPALFVNGIPVPGGAVAYEVVAAVLDAELERAGG